MTTALAALATTGQVTDVWLPIGGAILLLLGIGAVIFVKVRRKSE